MASTKGSVYEGDFPKHTHCVPVLLYICAPTKCKEVFTLKVSKGVKGGSEGNQDAWTVVYVLHLKYQCCQSDSSCWVLQLQAAVAGRYVLHLALIRVSIPQENGAESDQPPTL